MLFLLNTTVYDIGDPIATLTELNAPDWQTMAVWPAARIVQVGRAWFAKQPNLITDNPGAATMLACLIAARSDANAALYVVSPHCSGPEGVAWRLANVSISTLSALRRRQMFAPLAPSLVNEAVWKAAA